MALGRNIRAKREALGWTLQQLADASGVEVGTISALENRDSKRSEFAAALAQALGEPLDALVGHPPTYPRGASTTTRLVAQEASQLPITIIPVLRWEDLMSENVPQRFELAMPDDSMVPRVKQGQPITFSTTETPRPGDGVLVVDRLGAHYVRIYRQRTTEQWEAHALNEAFAPLESSRDGLRVVAVLVGVPARWG